MLQNNYIVAKSDGEDKRTKYLPTEEGTINGIIYGDNILQVDKLKLNNELLKKIKSKTEISTISKYAKMVNEILEDEYIYFSVDNNTFYSYLVKNEYLDEYVINNRKNKKPTTKGNDSGIYYNESNYLMYPILILNDLTDNLEYIIKEDYYNNNFKFKKIKALMFGENILKILVDS